MIVSSVLIAATAWTFRSAPLAAEYGISSEKIGSFGFSAGGHLSAASATSIGS